MLTDACVDSTVTRSLPRDQCRLSLGGNDYPIHLRHESDINLLRRTMTAAASRTARTTDARSGGNPTKRLWLEVTVPGDLTIIEIQGDLCDLGPFSPVKSVPFTFTPSVPKQRTGITERRAQEY